MIGINMDVTKVQAKDVRSGDKIVVNGMAETVTFVALVRGVQIQIKHRSNDLSRRMAPEQTMTVSKYEPIYKIV